MPLRIMRRAVLRQIRRKGKILRAAKVKVTDMKKKTGFV